MAQLSPSLNEIRDQGACGACWAFGAVSAMTDRYCIHSNQTKNFNFSAQDLIGCCPNCGIGCYGGSIQVGWNYWRDTGIVSGGNYNSSQGCRPYEIPPCEHDVPGKLPPCGHTPPGPHCVKSCQSGYKTDYEKDIRRGSSYSVSSDEEHIKAELFENGPVEVDFEMYPDFLNYKQGVYVHTEGGDAIGGHAVKLLGWGVEGGKKYWLVANSWNPEWGDKGFFKILRGVDHCGIETDVAAGKPIIE